MGRVLNFWDVFLVSRSMFISFFVFLKVVSLVVIFKIGLVGEFLDSKVESLGFWEW